MNWGAKRTRKRTRILTRQVPGNKCCKVVRLLRGPVEIGKDLWSNSGKNIPGSRSVAIIKIEERKTSMNDHRWRGLLISPWTGL